MKDKKITTIFVLCFTLGIFTAIAQPGSLDPTFGTNGKVTTVIGTNGGSINAIAIQADGKIVAAGSVATSNSTNIGLARYNTNGTLDMTFGTNGLVTTVLPSASSGANAIAIQPDGKIVIGGSSFVSNSDLAVVRYNTDGSLDATFSTDGIVVTGIGNTDQYCQSVAIQTDGKIVATGRTGTNPNFDFLTIRYNANGTIDPTFDSDGIVQTPVGTNDDRGNSVGIQPDGKIVVGGSSLNGNDFLFAIARYNTNGSLDNTFDADGIATMGIATYDCYGVSLVIQPDGKIAIGGSIDNGPLRTFGLARFNANGSPDVTFDTDGIVFSPVGTSNDQINTLLLQTNGKLVGAGVVTGSAPNDVDFAVARYNSDGSLDASFGNNGIVKTIWGNEVDQCKAAALQQDGKIIAAGTYSNISTIYLDYALARYNGDAVTGLDELNNAVNAINIYPNPFTNELVINGTNGEGEISIYNLQGALVMKKGSTLNSTILHTEKITPGIYFISYREGDKVVNLKIIK